VFGVHSMPGTYVPMTRLVRHVMANPVRALGPEMTASDAAGLMANYDIGVVPIIDTEGSLAGVVTDRDLREERGDGS
jgi:CBS domain-containing protein